MDGKPTTSQDRSSRRPSPSLLPHTVPYQAFDTPPSLDASHYIGQFQDQQFVHHGSPQLYGNNQFNQMAYQDNTLQDQTLSIPNEYNDYLDPDIMLSNDLTATYGFSNPSFGTGPTSNLNHLTDQPSPTANLLSPESHPSPRLQELSPTLSNSQFHTPQHSRQASLDPSAAYDIGSGSNTNNNGTWAGMQYRHQRIPSDQYSDRSSISHHSPHLGYSDLNESADPNRSPMLFPVQDSNTYGMEAFEINDTSPRLVPSQLHSLDSGSTQYSPNDIFQSTNYHGRHLSTVSDLGQASQLDTPAINIHLAPPSRQQSFDPNNNNNSSSSNSAAQGTLSPPPTSPRGRNRSQSDLTGLARPMSRSLSPALIKREDGGDSLSVRSTSPGPGGSRSPSPGVRDGRISKDRRASTNSVQNRDYILDLANPDRPNNTTGAGTGSSRVQKHPANFQCHICPKKFTRAYNLRSHLRTHTDERPFVCTVCGKAFARQHDRKRHEGLHSGEKKFVCRGELNSNPNQTWGCGRRFARADALGRHFRSEAGRVCIKPLLDEEANERRSRAMYEQQIAHGTQMDMSMAQQQQYDLGLQPVPPGMVLPLDPNIGSITAANSFALPAALMAQYPQLANLDWNAISSGHMPDELDGDLGDIGYDDGEGYGVTTTGMNMVDINSQSLQWQPDGG